MRPIFPTRFAGARAAMREARANRSLQEQQIRLQVQQALQDLEVTQSSLGTAAKRVEAATGAFRIASRKRDLGQINQAELEQLLTTTPGTRDVNNPVRLLRTELNLGIDTDKAGLLGVSALEANRTVRLAVAGLTAGKFRAANGDEYGITLRMPMHERPTIDMLDRIDVGTASGRQVPLRQIANPHFESVSNSITRYNRERQVTVMYKLLPPVLDIRETADPSPITGLPQAC